MRKQNRIKKSAILILIIFFLLSPLNFNGTVFLKIGSVARADTFDHAPYDKHDGQIDIIDNVIWTKDYNGLTNLDTKYVKMRWKN